MTTHFKDLDIIGEFTADLHCPAPFFAAAAKSRRAEFIKRLGKIGSRLRSRAGTGKL
jgi:hypothetical protein